MKCPRCAGISLDMAERQGVEIDYCPECSGISLVRGELQKIIERSYGHDRLHSTSSEIHHDHGEFGDYRRSEHDRNHGKHHRRRSWLSELFD